MLSNWESIRTWDQRFNNNVILLKIFISIIKFRGSEIWNKHINWGWRSEYEKNESVVLVKACALWESKVCFGTKHWEGAITRLCRTDIHFCLLSWCRNVRSYLKRHLRIKKWRKLQEWSWKLIMRKTSYFSRRRMGRVSALENHWVHGCRLWRTPNIAGS